MADWKKEERSKGDEGGMKIGPAKIISVITAIGKSQRIWTHLNNDNSELEVE